MEIAFPSQLSGNVLDGKLVGRKATCRLDPFAGKPQYRHLLLLRALYKPEATQDEMLYGLSFRCCCQCRRTPPGFSSLVTACSQWPLEKMNSRSALYADQQFRWVMELSHSTSGLGHSVSHRESKGSLVVMAKASKRIVRRAWTTQDERELKKHSKSKAPVRAISRRMRRTTGSLRQKARQLGFSIGHQPRRRTRRR